MTTTTHATCEDCQRVMDPNVGCTMTHVSKGPDAPLVKRVFMGEEADDWGVICHDCNAGQGQVHHAGCDGERCPECGGQMIGCLVGDASKEERAEWEALLGPSCGWTHLATVKSQP